MTKTIQITDDDIDKLIESLKKIHDESLQLQEWMNILDVIQRKRMVLQWMKSIYGDIKLGEAIDIMNEQYQNALKYKQ